MDRLPPVGPSLRVFHIGGYWRRDNDTVRHMMLGLRQTGTEVVEFSTDEHREALDTDGRPYDRGRTGPVWLRPEVLGPLFEEHDPHLVICNAGGLAFRAEAATAVRRSRRLLGIALSDPAVFEPTTRRIAANFDLFLTNHPSTLSKYTAIGARAAPLRFGTNPEYFRPAQARPDLTCDVLIMGHAHADRIEPVRRLMRTLNVHVYGEGWGEHGIPTRGLIFGDESLAALASAYCVVVFDRGLHGDRLVKPSLFDFTAAGALVVTNDGPAVSSYFVTGEELAVFRDVDDLARSIRRLLHNPADAAQIRRAGRARTLRDHTWASSWRTMLDPRREPIT